MGCALPYFKVMDRLEMHMMGGYGGLGAGSQAPGKDPVCGMDVAADQGYSSSWHGTTYRFCSRDCLDKFEAAPASFATAAKGNT